MVAKYLILFSMLFLLSCGMKTRTLENNITSVPFENKVFKNKYLFETKCLKGIDTAALYKEEYGYVSAKNSFKNNNENKYYQSSSSRSYYKFYKNGQINYFLFRDFDEVTLSSINPNFDGQRGVLYSEKNELKLDLFTIVGYGYGREYGITCQIIRIQGDTIFEKSIKNLEYVTVYVKKKLPKEFLIYKPDW
jgi:hypothetical protein